jgi:nitrite reductase/ring-hydroxylating ferredoxin subunit
MAEIEREAPRERRESQPSARVRAAGASEIPEGGCKVIVHGHNRIAIFRVNGALHAIDDHCPHEGWSLASGTIEGSVVTCAGHDWQIDVRSRGLTMRSIAWGAPGDRGGRRGLGESARRQGRHRGRTSGSPEMSAWILVALALVGLGFWVTRLRDRLARLDDALRELRSDAYAEQYDLRDRAVMLQGEIEKVRANGADGGECRGVRH